MLQAVVELQDDWLAAQQQEEHEAMLRQLAALEQVLPLSMSFTGARSQQPQAQVLLLLDSPLYLVYLPARGPPPPNCEQDPSSAI